MRDCSYNECFHRCNLMHNADQLHCGQANETGIFTPQIMVQAQNLKD
jgi:hypothetical protein